MENCVYIISGPPAVEKSSVSNELAYTYDKSAVIEGDMIYLMIRSGLVAPWEDKGYYMDLLWDNIISITDNLIKRDITVIIEYVIFKEQIKKIESFLKARQKKLKYCVLLAEEQTLKERDLSRKEIERTGDLSIRSREEFLSKNISSNNLLYMDNLDIKEITNIIKSSDRFFV